jgi:hypothetical protein
MPRRALLLAALGLLVVPASASAVTVSRAELSGGNLRVEGRAAANATVTVASPESTASRSSDGSGNFRVETSGFRSSTCQVTVSDGGRTATATARLSGCTVSSPTPPPTTQPPPTNEPPPPPPTTSTCTILPTQPVTVSQGELITIFWSTTGCRTSNQITQWSLVAGQIPPGMTGPFTQGVGSGFITGRPSTQGTFTFTVRVRDQTGASDTEVQTVTVVAPQPVTITTQGFSNGTVGVSPCCWNLFSSGGTPGYTYRVVAGALPPGTSIQRFSNGTRIAGTPTTAGTFSFSLVSTDSRGAQSAPTPFSITVNPRT